MFYRKISNLLDYPNKLTQSLACECRVEEKESLSQALDAFVKYLQMHPMSDMEELYTRTFDMNPAHCLELGFQLFGENYKRGLFLIKMKETATRFGVDIGIELADHLTVVLRVLHLLDREDAKSLVLEVVLPGIGKILQAFQDLENPYYNLLQGLQNQLMFDFQIKEFQPATEGMFDRDPSGRIKLPVLDNVLSSGGML